MAIKINEIGAESIRSDSTRWDDPRRRPQWGLQWTPSRQVTGLYYQDSNSMHMLPWGVIIHQYTHISNTSSYSHVQGVSHVIRSAVVWLWTDVTSHLHQVKKESAVQTVIIMKCNHEISNSRLDKPISTHQYNMSCSMCERSFWAPVDGTWQLPLEKDLLQMQI